MSEAPIVIVGAGPVGVRVAAELARRMPDAPLVLYGAERWSPYNRVRLSSALAGETAWVDLLADAQLPDGPHFETRLGCAVLAVDRANHSVLDAEQRMQPYRALVLATGSAPHLPAIPGITLPGVYVFRDMDHAVQLAARRARTHRTVVVGGGLLGIEAARAMQRSGTEVILVEHDNRLMPRQLDDGASAALQANVEACGIQVILGDGPVGILGEARVVGVQLRSGRQIRCDTVVVAAGIRPSIELARRAGLNVGRGIRVDDDMRTTDPRIFAVGECAEHRGRLYGLVAPGLEQAGVAAHVIAGGDASYRGSSAATRLKVLHYPVFSMGEIGNEEMPEFAREVVYADATRKLYRKLVVRRGRLIGALALGDWGAIPRVQEALSHGRRLLPWQLWQFRRHGELWREDEALQASDWPAHTVVCNCTGVTRGRLSKAVDEGCGSVAELSACTGAGTVCGSCKPLLQALVGGNAPREPVAAAGKLWTIGLIGAALALCLLCLPGLPYPGSVAVPWHWDAWWREPLPKQISGYSLLGLALALGVLGLRKRVRRFTLGGYDAWRWLHAALGTAMLAGYVVHTGGHWGVQLNRWLSISFIGAALAGATFAAVLAREHRVDAVLARQLKNGAWWSHLLFLWPLPVLLAFHIAQEYVF